MDHTRFYRTELDRRVWEEELDSFVPGRVFDAHTHLWSEAFSTAETPENSLRTPVDGHDQQLWHGEVFPGREQGFMFLGSPVPRINFPGEREWLVNEARRIPRTVCGVLVTPETTPEELDRDASQWHFKALKPYLSYAPLGGETPIRGMLPENLLEVAEVHHLMIVLHVAKSDCFSDPENLRDLQYFVKRYPHVTWQLAHCARSFNGCFLEKAVHILKNVENICYDLSAVSDDYSFYLLFRYEDLARLMYGTDGPVVGGIHGRFACYGRSWGLIPPRNQADQSSLLCYEQLRCIRHAAEMAELSRSDLENIFWDNALRIYQIN